MRLQDHSFARHETFPLRFNWIPKAFSALKKDPDVFRSETATVQLGVGKNMVTSIRYWMGAAGLITPDDQPTSLGEFLFDDAIGVDPYLEDIGTTWLLHWLLASNAARATAIFWFFNSFHKRSFTTDEAITGLRDFVNESVSEKKRPSANSQKSDISVLTRMYASAFVDKKAVYEDILSSPFTDLGLLFEAGGKGKFTGGLDERLSLPPEILMFAINSVVDSEQGVLELDTLLHFRDGVAAPGVVFRLNEDAFVTKLEQACQMFSDSFRLERSGVLAQLFKLQSINELDLLRHYFSRDRRKAA